MSQTLSIELVNGTLALDEATLRAAQIMHKARVILQERAILILPEAESEAERRADPVNSAFGLIQLPRHEIVPLTVATLEASVNVRLQHGLLTNDSLLVAAMQELNLQKLATLDQDFARVSGLLVYQPTDMTPTT